MNKYLRLSLPFLFALVTLNTNLSAAQLAEIHEETVANFSQFCQLVMAHRSRNPKSVTLCFADLDDTTLKYNGFIGTEAWFSRVLEKLGRSIENPISEMFFAALTAHQMNIDTVRPTEPAVVGVYTMIQDILTIPVIGLTSRTYILSQITGEQLHRLGITFGTPWREEIILNEDPTWVAKYNPTEGVIYCSGNNKGVILATLLRETMCRIETPEGEIDTIIVIDNEPKHLTRIKDAMSKAHPQVNLILVTYNSSDAGAIQEQQQQQQQQQQQLEQQLDFVQGMIEKSRQKVARKGVEKHLRSSSPLPIPARTTSAPVFPKLEADYSDDPAGSKPGSWPKSKRKSS